MYSYLYITFNIRWLPLSHAGQNQPTTMPPPIYILSSQNTEMPFCNPLLQGEPRHTEKKPKKLHPTETIRLDQPWSMWTRFFRHSNSLNYNVALLP